METSKEAVKDAKKETLQDLDWKVDAALKSGQDWVETTKENLHYHSRGGVGPEGYITYKGVKVCEFGKLKELEAKDDAPVPSVNFVTAVASGPQAS